MNQYLIRTGVGCYFQSYNTMIACADRQGNITLDADNWDYSKTTLKYLRVFLDLMRSPAIYSKDVRQAISNGTIALTNLN